MNDRLETTAEGVFATRRHQRRSCVHAHCASDFPDCFGPISNEKRARFNPEPPGAPSRIFIDPQLGRIGLTETESRSQGRNIRIAKLPMSRVARALEVDETRGFMKAIIDADTNQILGAAILGIEGGEIMSAVEIAMMGKVVRTALRDGTFAHPTLAESLNNLFLAMDSSS